MDIGLSGLFGSVISGGLGAIGANQQAEATERANRENLNFAREQSAWQQGFAQQQFGYNASQNALMQAREDTAVQRRSQDLAAAGLSPLLAAGQPASAQHVQSNVSGGPGFQANQQPAYVDFSQIINGISQGALAMKMLNEAHTEGYKQDLMEAQAGLTEESQYEKVLKNVETNYNLHNKMGIDMQGRKGAHVVHDDLADKYMNMQQAEIRNREVEANKRTQDRIWENNRDLRNNESRNIDVERGGIVARSQADIGRAAEAHARARMLGIETDYKIEELKNYTLNKFQSWVDTAARFVGLAPKRVQMSNAKPYKLRRP